MDTAQIRIETGIENITAANNWSIYPNPTKDKFYILGAADNLQHILISNLSGQKVMQIEYPHSNDGIDISKLEIGVYFVSLQSAKGNTSTLRLIKR
jgi:hypothetical protein